MMYTHVLAGLGRTLFLSVLLCCAVVPSGLAAQTAEPANAQALREKGEAEVFGKGTADDIKAGLKDLEAAVQAGDVKAKAILGKILLDGHYATADVPRALRLLDEAAGAGSADAALTLGSALLWGYRTEKDTGRARQLLERAASLGSAEGMRVLGEQLVSGSVWPAEPQSGVALLEKSIALGDAKSNVTLGKLLLYGQSLKADRPRALKLFEAAAQSGNGEGLENYGEWLLWRNEDAAAAEKYLRRAGELGRGRAWSVLAEGAMYGYLGQRSRQRFSEFAEKAVAAGETRIAILEANRQMWGISMRASGPKTLAGLEAAAQSGNKDAALFLISLLRDGNHLNIRKDVAKATAYVDAFKALLSPLEASQLLFTLDAASDRTDAGLRRLAAGLKQHPELMNEWFGHEVVKANPNLAVFLLQSRLKEQGRFAGRLDGLAGDITVSALKGYCAEAEPKVSCRDGVLAPGVTAALLAR
jgi:TPR repeat protein